MATGTWDGLDYALALTLGEHDLTWSWDLEVVNRTGARLRVDAVLTHDPALAPEGAVANNQYYVSQYLDVTPVDTADRGVALAVRQNMPGERVPWVVIASAGRGVGWATDAHQLVSRTTTGTAWSGLDRDLPSERLQHEHTLVAIQDAPADLDPDGRHHTGFVGLVVEDHPEATGPDDVRHVETALAAVRATPAIPSVDGVDDAPVADGAATALATAPVLACVALTEHDLALLELTAEPGSTEHDADGVATTWRTVHGEVVTASRELSVLRPHGQVLRTGDTLVPDAGSLTTTVWMGGTFHSQVTAGHVGRDTMLTGRRSYLGLFRGQGLRVLVRDADDAGWELLDVPSAWCNGLDECRWWYATGDGRLVEVVSRAPAARHELSLDVRVVRGPETRLMVTLDTGCEDAPDLDLDWSGEVAPEQDEDWLVLDVAATHAWRLTLRSSHPGGVPGGVGEEFWPDVIGSLRLDLDSGTTESSEVAAITDAVPWFAHDALIHYLAPRGLEQYSGGGWGTRDVCQGPVGLLTAIDRHHEVHDVLLRVMHAQNARGDWPQAFEFMPPSTEHGQQDSHGDVVYRPVLAAGEHLLATGDAAILSEEAPFVGDDEATAPASVEEHLRRAVRRIEEMAGPGTPLPAYGHGDWNDSLQPADPELARRMASTWTAVLQVQALDALARPWAVGAADDLADEADALAARTPRGHREDMAVERDARLPALRPGRGRQRRRAPRPPRRHPHRPDLRHLPGIHAITLDVLHPESAQAHLRLVEQHLLGPDGARLFDRPVAYRGGPMSTFQRAEASTFWGREIGLMYVHAHLRYAEALSRVGDGAGPLRALALVSPWGLTQRVPQARPRQRSCYYSSSDGAFADRADASERYPDLMAGRVPLEGGWRVTPPARAWPCGSWSSGCSACADAATSWRSTPCSRPARTA